MTGSEPSNRPRRLRPDLPFRRIALVLSGGGALAAYEVGALRALEALGLRPAIIAGVSSGAMNAVLWIAHGFRTGPLVDAWRRVRGSTIGMRWMTLAWRAVGSFLVMVAGVEILLSLAGSSELSAARWALGRANPGPREAGSVLDVLAWSLVGAVGLLVLAGSRRAEELLARLRGGPKPWQRRIGWLLLAGLAVHLAAWTFGWPYPHRFSAVVLLVAFVVWLAERPGRVGRWVRSRAIRLLPEAGGLGLWRSEARRRMLVHWMMQGDPRRVLDPATHLIMSTCNVSSGRMRYFINWRDADGAFTERIRGRLAEVAELTDITGVVRAAVASSAIPFLFEPVEHDGDQLVDAGVLSNQPIEVALADGADAVVVVLLAPAHGPASDARPRHLLDLGFRLLEIVNWRDVQAELDGLPEAWKQRGEGERPSGGAAPLCLVEPEQILPGGMYGYLPSNADELMRRGERDAWRALERSGWIEPEPA